ncbi:AraC family transcriptional regulator [Paenibacillus sp. DCT19]|uniref:helix-turn-helix transcriptional regulator n=1 Tax=Paenibacillus sp. DCT19 TaxID=2211212 RepID=UPI000FE1F8D5
MHSAKFKGENDIVFNVIFRKSFFSSNFLSQIADKGILGDFFLNAIIDNRSHDNYLVFQTQDNPKFLSIVNLLLFEYYWPSTCHTSLVEHYLSILFLELINTLHQYTESNYLIDDNQKNMMKILNYIEGNFSNCSLEDLTKHTHFSTSYIFKLLKSMTGSSFSTLKLQQQLKRAEFLLVNTSLPISEIIEQIGLKNPTYFYNKFKEVYNKTPSEYRKIYARIT